MVLNDEIELEKAQTYSSLVRTLAQTVSAETTRARFHKTSPNLDIPDPSEGE